MEDSQKPYARDAITFVIFTYNEEKRIDWAIRSFLDWGKILIVDNYSEDRTVEIARSLGCDILLNKNQGWVEDFATTERVKATVQTDWIYWGFADEIVERKTLSAILEAIHCGDFSIVNIIRKNYFYGQFCYNALAHRMNRVFKKNALDFRDNRIHGFGKVTVPSNEICYLDEKKHFVHHFISSDASTYLRSMDRYVALEVSGQQDHENRRGFWMHALKLITTPIKVFVGNILLRRGFMGGRPALYLLLDAVFYKWLLAMKRYESSRLLTVKAIEELNNGIRSQLLGTGVTANGHE